MPHINDLPTIVLRQILCHVAATPADTLRLWKSKLPLLAVSRAWTKLAQPFVLNHVYVEAFGACANSGPFAGAPSNDMCIGWISNAELLISRHCVLMARRLTIEIAYGNTLSHLEHVALDILKLDCVDWMHINLLTVIGASLLCEHSFDLNRPGDSADIDVSIEGGVASTMEYFGQNVRNVVELNLTNFYLGAIGHFVCTSLASMYSRQLRVLRAQGHILLPISHFTRNLVVLELTLDSEAARVLPSICGETLRVLKLDRIPRNFAWYHFRYDLFVRPIVFPRLATLHLSYDDEDTGLTEDEVRDKVTLGSFNCDQLYFPVLNELSIRNCTPDCDLLYADTPFPELRHAHLSGSIDSINHCRRLKLGWVGDLKVRIYTLWTGLSTDIHDVTNHFFTNICIGRVAALNVHNILATIDPELVRWANLTSLQLALISYEPLCKLVARLPNLTDIHTECLEFGAVLADGFSKDESLFRSMDLMLAWGELLIMITIGKLGDTCPVDVGAYGIQAIISHATSLKRLTVPELVKPLVTAFVDRSKSRFSHFANIELTFNVP